MVLLSSHRVSDVDNGDVLFSQSDIAFGVYSVFTSYSNHAIETDHLLSELLF